MRRTLLWVTPLIALLLLPFAAQAAGKKTAELIVERARLEATRQVTYDSSYKTLKYPGGDVASDRGVCADVIVRALRAAGYDLQRLIHDDKRANPSLYPTIGGSRRLDANIDHRRCANHIAFLKRHAKTLSTSLDSKHLADWQAGDLVYIDLNPGRGQLLHCGIVSDVKDEMGIPLLIHNIGPVATEEDALASFQIIGHYRFPTT